MQKRGCGAGPLKQKNHLIALINCCCFIKELGLELYKQFIFIFRDDYEHNIGIKWGIMDFDWTKIKMIT